MADVKWIKLATNIFDNRKIKQIETLPESDAIIVMWIKLLCLAGSINDNGCIYFTKEIPYTEQMLSTQFNMPLTTVQLALQTFEQFGMVEVIDDIVMISNWEKYQNVEGMEKIREQNRIRKQNQRLREKEQKMIECDSHVTVTHSHATDIDKNKNRLREDKNIILAQSDLGNRSMPAIITLTLNDKSEYPIYQTNIDEWKELYQSVDVLQELRKMKGWLDANPKKRKTKNGIKRFINSWLSREQDKCHIDSSNDSKKSINITKFDV